MNSTPYRRSWRSASGETPCPVCGKSDWCRVSTDGILAACRRIADGAKKSKIDKSGTPIYLHRLVDDLTVAPERSPTPRLTKPAKTSAAGPAVEKADAETLHRAYSIILDRLTLSEAHREALRRRGLSDAEIDHRGYRSFPLAGRRAIAAQLVEALDKDKAYRRIPGFIETKGGPTLTGPEGLLIPCRDTAGQTVALKVRRDAPAKGRSKYVYLSSAKRGGAGSGAPPHVALGAGGAIGMVRLTEGELKADIATVLSGILTISAPGAGGWRACLPILKALGVEVVRLAFDADASTNANVARALRDCAEQLAALGYAVELERWQATDGKGIDDLLAAGKQPEVLTGDEAQAAVRQIAKAAGAICVADTRREALDRLPHVLNDGGAAAFFRDKELLTALAWLKRNDPAEFAVVRETLRIAQVRMKELDAALKPLLQSLANNASATREDGERYVVSETGCICRVRYSDEGPIESPLCNFNARIVEQVTHDDGAERRTVLALEGMLAGGGPLSRAEILAEDFAWMNWPVVSWGTQAVVYAGAPVKDHLRAAIQILSSNVPRRTVFGHTGWRKIDDRWHYLHAAGAIGPEGPAADITIELPESLARYSMPTPPVGDQLAAAVQASLRLLDLAPAQVMFPLLAAVFRAALGDADFSLHIAGPTGVFKSELTALAQQHYGAGLDARHLPGSWLSTGNALEGLAFVTKDAVFAVDDFAPTGSSADVQRFHREADRLFRAQGNHAGRQRMRADGGLRPTKPPRGLIVSTGEDIPRGQSLRGRLMILEIASGDVNRERLTDCQRDAQQGRYAQTLAAFVRWLAPQYDSVRSGLVAEAAELRNAVAISGQHARTPGIVADLAIGLRYFLTFAVEVGSLTVEDSAKLWEAGWQAIGAAAEEQAGHQQAGDPHRRVFASAKMSVCILIAKRERSKQNAEIKLRIHETSSIDVSRSTVLVRPSEISQFDSNYSIPLVSQDNIGVLRQIYCNSTRLSEVGNCFTGEVDLTLCRDFITDDPRKSPMHKGAIIDRYRIRTKMSQGEIEFLDSKAYLKAKGAKPTSSAWHHKEPRIILQGITGVNEKRRLKMTYIGPGTFCANSANYIRLNDASKRSLLFTLAILNSNVANFVFKCFSTNSNVNSYEVNNLPIPPCTDHDKNKLAGLAEQCLAAKDSELPMYEAEIERLVRRLYGLTPEG